MPFSTKDANNTTVKFDIQGDGSDLTPFVARSPTILTNLLDSIGLPTDTANTTGTLHAKLRSLLTDTFGAVADVASATGTFMARIRLIAQSYTPATIFTRWTASNGDVISGTPARVTGFYVHNKTTSLRYFQLFNRTAALSGGAVPIISRAILPSTVYSVETSQLGSGDGFTFGVGLAWGVSTTEATYTAGLTTDVSVEIYWRSI